MHLITLKSMTYAAVAGLTIIALAVPVQAEQSKGKMKNEWTVNKMATKDGDAKKPKAKMGSGSGAGKVNVQDISITDKTNTGGTAVKKKETGMFLKLGPIKGE